MKAASRLKLAATAASIVRAATRPGGLSLADRVQAVPRLVRATLDGRYAGTTVGRLGLVAGALAYVASPIDLLPEAILPVVGAADDAVVIGWAIRAFVEETDRFAAWERVHGAHRSQTVRGEATWSDDAAAAAPAEDVRNAGGRTRLPEGMRQAATDYVMETVRKRLER